MRLIPADDDVYMYVRTSSNEPHDIVWLVAASLRGPMWTDDGYIGRLTKLLRLRILNQPGDE